jgi:type IV fimbrial biogenesis protein FimT
MLKRLQTGVSLIEVMIGIGILAMLMALGVPQYGIFLANARLKATADTLVSGLSLARAEAVKRNARVEMVLTDDDPEEAVVNGLNATLNGPNWMVRQWVPSTGVYSFIEGKLGGEGSGSAGGRITATGATASFNGFGGLTSGGAITYNIDNPSGGACDQAPPATRGPMRCLRVIVSPGGQIRTCDPAVDPVATPTDTRAC